MRTNGTRFAVYVFLGELQHLHDFMSTMQMMRLFDKGEYMVISVDWEIYSPERAKEYLWSQWLKHFTRCKFKFNFLQIQSS